MWNEIAGYILWVTWRFIAPLPPAALAGLLVVVALVLSRLWPKAVAGQTVSPLPVQMMMGIFVLLDAVLLFALPWLGLSYGPITMPLIGITGLRFLVFMFIELGTKLRTARLPAPRAAGGLRGGKMLLLSVNVCITGAALYGMYFEPFNLQTTELSLPGPNLIPGRPLRILHIADLHVERITRRDLEVLERSRELQPDVILMTGDYVNIDYTQDARTWEDTRWLLSQLEAPYGVYAVTGTPGVDTPDVVRAVFEQLPVRLLRDEIVPLRFPGGELTLVGVKNLAFERDRQALQNLLAQIPPEAYTLLLYHSPDLIETAAGNGVDMYLGGHTHGGQVRLPFYGAVVTSSRYGRKYASGLFAVDNTTMYISRGLGMEGLNMPRVRFLCPPEITLIELQP